MNITLQLSDAAYRHLVSGSGRIQGTIGLVSPTEGNFNEHVKSKPRTGMKYIRLRHGRASVCEKSVRLTLRVGLDETDVVPSEIIADESRQAGDFIDTVFDREF